MNDIIRRLTAPLLAQGEPAVYAAECCGRIFVSIARPETCGKCNQPFDAIEVRPEGSEGT